MFLLMWCLFPGFALQEMQMWGELKSRPEQRLPSDRPPHQPRCAEEVWGWPLLGFGTLSPSFLLGSQDVCSHLWPPLHPLFAPFVPFVCLLVLSGIQVSVLVFNISVAGFSFQTKQNCKSLAVASCPGPNESLDYDKYSKTFQMNPNWEKAVYCDDYYRRCYLSC